MKKVIVTTNSPAPIGPYSQAIEAGNFVFVTGQIPMDPSTGELISGGILAETIQVMKNVGAVLSEAGLGFEHIVKATIFLTDMGAFSEVNEVYGSFFTNQFPARETVQVSALPKYVNVEISVIAVKP